MTTDQATGLSEDTTDIIESSELHQLEKVHIDDVIEYVNDGLRAIPTPLALYKRYLRQRWDVYDLDFTQDAIDWREKMTDEERAVFLRVAQGFHHGERNVEAELPAFMMGAAEEDKIFITSHMEDEARHVQYGMGFLQESVRRDPSLANEIYDMLRIIFDMNSSQGNVLNLDALGLSVDELRRFNVVQLVRKLTDVGIPLPDDLKATIDKMYPEVTGG